MFTSFSHKPFSFFFFFPLRRNETGAVELHTLVTQFFETDAFLSASNNPAECTHSYVITDVEIKRVIRRITTRVHIKHKHLEARSFWTFSHSESQTTVQAEDTEKQLAVVKHLHSQIPGSATDIMSKQHFLFFLPGLAFSLKGALVERAPCMFTVETVSLGHFLQVPFPLFIQKGEEEHFLKGKPAFQAQMKSKHFNKSADRGTLCIQFLFSTYWPVNTYMHHWAHAHVYAFFL